MAMHVLDQKAQDQIIRERRERGLDRWDEVWDGEYLVMPDPNLEHQQIATRLSAILVIVIDWPRLGMVYQGMNVSDRADDWEQNYRCPDVGVCLQGNPGVNRGAYWHGGPDFVVEIVSPHDRSREKLGFYASVGVRELLLIDRDPWALELCKRRKSKLARAGTSTPAQPKRLASAVLPLSFQLQPGEPRPQIEVAHTDGRQSRAV
jgi:Uma2 family endonuclease